MSDELPRSVAIGKDNSVYLIGKTTSTNFPITPGAVQTVIAGANDAFIMKLVPVT